MPIVTAAPLQEVRRCEQGFVGVVGLVAVQRWHLGTAELPAARIM